MMKHKHNWQFGERKMSMDTDYYAFLFVCECGAYKEVEPKEEE